MLKKQWINPRCYGSQLRLDKLGKIEIEEQKEIKHQTYPFF